jgi:Tfp pilus assembly protein PilV
MKKSFTLLEILIVMFIATTIIAGLMRMININFFLVKESMENRMKLKSDLEQVLRKQENNLNNSKKNDNLGFYIQSGFIVKNMVILGKE